MATVQHPTIFLRWPEALILLLQLQIQISHILSFNHFKNSYQILESLASTLETTVMAQGPLTIQYMVLY